MMNEWEALNSYRTFIRNNFSKVIEMEKQVRRLRLGGVDR